MLLCFEQSLYETIETKFKNPQNMTKTNNKFDDSFAKNLAIVILSKSAPASLHQILRSYNTLGAQTPIYILLSDKLDEKYFSQYRGSISRSYVLPTEAPAQKIRHALKLITEFIALCTDDDYFSLNSIIESARFL